MIGRNSNKKGFEDLQIEALQHFTPNCKLVHYVDNEQRTCLHYATFCSSTGMLDTLLSHGANLHAADRVRGRSINQCILSF